MDAMYPYASPYNGFGNNPVYYIDPSGAVIEPSTAAKSYFEKLKEHGNLLVKVSSSEIKRLSTAIETATGNKKEKMQKELNGYRQTLNAANAMLSEFEEMEQSSTVYKIKIRSKLPTENKGGHAALDISDETYNTVEILVLLESSVEADGIVMGKMAHELKHGYQYQTKKMAFKTSNGGAIPGIYDIEDEVEAYQRQRDLGLGGGIMGKGDILASDIYPLSPSYKNLPPGQQTLDTPANPNATNGQHLDKQTYQAGQKGKKPPFIYIGWRAKYDEGAANKIDEKDEKK